MRKPALVGALLLVAIGVVLGATVFRTDIAQATGLAQSVTVNNTPAQPVPVAQHVATRHESGQVIGGAIGTPIPSVSFSTVDASLIVLQAGSDHSFDIRVKKAGDDVLRFVLAPNERLVLPLTQPVSVDEVKLASCFGGGASPCSTDFNIIGS